MSERKWRIVIVWRENRRDAETQEGPAIYTSCRAAQNDADSLSKQHTRNHRKQLVRKVAGFRDVDLRNVPNELLQQIIDIVETE
jgi:hypothetical protein